MQQSMTCWTIEKKKCSDDNNDDDLGTVILKEIFDMTMEDGNKKKSKDNNNDKTKKKQCCQSPSQRTLSHGNGATALTQVEQCKPTQLQRTNSTTMTPILSL